MNENTCILMFSYNRPTHFEKVFKNISQNSEFSDMQVVIHQDGKKNIVDDEWEKMKNLGKKIAEERKNVVFLSKEKNYGCRLSIISGITEALKSFDSAIIIEDDIVVSKEFLHYMLLGIDYYKNIKQVGCITGYNHPKQLMEIPSNYNHDIYFTLRSCSWGWATWRDRWKDIDWNIKDFKSFRFNISLRNKFKIWGDDLWDMLRAQVRGQINAWDIALTYHFFKKNMYTVYPVVSFVENIGHDGSGENCKVSNSDLFVNLNLNSSRDIIFEPPFLDQRIVKAFSNVYKRNLSYYKRKIMHRIKKLFVK